MHILNLVVKSIMHQFDVWMYVSKDSKERYKEMADDIDAEEIGLEGDQQDYCEDEPENPNNDNGWIDERDGMEDKKLEELEDKIQPICVLLTKVGKSHLLCCTVLANLSTCLTLLMKASKTPV